MKTESRIFFAMALVAGLIAGWATGCGSTSLRTQATIGPAGGTLSLPSEGVTLEVPAGALTSTMEVTLSASSDARGVLVGIEPAQLALARSALLAVTLSRPVHFSSVTEVSAEGEWPLGLQSRVETATGASARLLLDRFIQVRLTTDGPTDGGAPGACREHEDGDGDQHRGDDGDGAHDGGDDDGHDHGEDAGIRHDGGSDEHHEDGGIHRDGGTIANMECPAGFECDDGVCVAPGGDDEEEHGHCGDADAGSCPTGLHCEDGHCVAPRDGGHGD